MESRLKDVPALKITEEMVEAHYFNRFRLGLLRLGNPLRFELPSLRGMDVLLGDEAWICVDTTLNDLPVIAWTDFQMAHRVDIYRAVPCRLRLFHYHAGLIKRTVLNETERLVTVALSEQTASLSRPVTYLSKD